MAIPEPERIDVRVRSLRWECAGVLRVEVEATNGRLPEPEPGAHIDLFQNDAPTRQYSLTAGSTSESYMLGIRHEANSRGGSEAVHTKLRPGDMVRISPPRNAFPLVAGGDVFLIAGGIGVTPLLYMAETLSKSDRNWRMLFCARSPADAPFQSQVATLGVPMRYDDVDGIPDLPAMIADIPEDTHIYCCGPEPMLSAFEDAVSGRNSEFVHLERFTAPRLEANSDEFVVELARSGEEFVITGSETILEKLLAEGKDVPHSCSVGVCGTCETRVLAGTPDHKDLVLTEEEKAGGSMMICCSRAKSNRLILDL